MLCFFAMITNLPAPHQETLAHYDHCLTEAHYSPASRKNYCAAFRQFLAHHAPRPPLELARQDILNYLTLRVAAGASATYQNRLIDALKFYYEQVEFRQPHNIPRPKRPPPRPQVLTQSEIKALLQGTTNHKHCAMLMLAYGLGLRLGEVLALVPADIDSKRQTLHVCGGKSRKARCLPLPTSLLSLLREQLQEFCPVTFLFEGQQPGVPYSARSLQQVVQQAASRVGIQRPVTLQMLRHSYATHLLEAGADMRLLQDLMGHSSIKVTGVYARVARKARLVSPLDGLGLKDR